MNILAVEVERKEKDISIHPGVINGRRMHPLKNTCKPNRRTGRVFKKVQDRYDQRLSSHASTLNSLPSNVNKLSFKKPGSRNPSKLRQR